MEQNQVQKDLSAFRDPFRYNTFYGFNSHNHIVVTEVGEGTSVVEVEMTQDAMNPSVCAMWRPALLRVPVGASP